MPLWRPLRARLRACAPARVHAPAHVREARSGALEGLLEASLTFLNAIKSPARPGRRIEA